MIILMKDNLINLIKKKILKDKLFHLRPLFIIIT
jgi:hypothetical protein